MLVGPGPLHLRSTGTCLIEVGIIDGSTVTNYLKVSNDYILVPFYIPNIYDLSKTFEYVYRERYIYSSLSKV
jgi:hypothetical protein